jgi:flagellum-specific ATP synthase
MQIIDPESLSVARGRGQRWSQLLDAWRLSAVEGGPLLEGSLVKAAGLALEASGCTAAIGSRCLVQSAKGEQIEAEVVGFADERIFLMPTEQVTGLAPHARVTPLGQGARRGVGEALLGRVVDALGRPLDALGRLRCEATAPLRAGMINPLLRRPISEPLDVGVRSINALLTAGRGQRLGLFAGSGVGKSSLLAMMTRYSQADVIVVGLIGERGREVREFIEDNLGPEGLARAVVVATPSDASALMRLHGALYATSIAEYFRDRGRHVLFLMDSLTRFAQAQREIGLSIGEPPATRGYPPSVFACLPELIERTGNGSTTDGSITAFYTVLVEGDDHADPIADTARATLDGHIMLSREIADGGLYPPVDVEASISRSMPRLVTSEQLAAAHRFKDMFAYYMRHRDLITVGAYTPGSDPKLDVAVRMWPQMENFLRQDLNQAVSLTSARTELRELFAGFESKVGEEGATAVTSQRDNRE